MNYETYEPSTALHAFVKCYWCLDGEKLPKPAKQMIVPDGCAELIFHYGDRYEQFLQDGTSIVQPRCFVIGQLTRPLTIRPTGQTGIFAVRFHPEGLMPLVALPLQQLENTAISIQTLFGDEGNAIADSILAANDTQARIRHIERFLLDRLMHATSVDRIIKQTVELIMILKGRLPIDQLADQMNIDSRQLERKFATLIGLSPKKLSKMVRMQATLSMYLRHPTMSLTTLAHAGSYYDQAHFIKDFKSFVGLSPKKFYSENLRMSTLFHGAD